MLKNTVKNPLFYNTFNELINLEKLDLHKNQITKIDLNTFNGLNNFLNYLFY